MKTISRIALVLLISLLASPPFLFLAHTQPPDETSDGILLSGDSLSNWSSTYASLALSTNTYYTEPASIAWTTKRASNQFISWVTLGTGGYGVYWDLSTTPILHARVNPQVIPPGAYLQVVMYDSNWVYYSYAPTTLVAGTWTDINIDLRTPLTGGTPSLDKVYGIQFYWVFNGGLKADFTTYIDEIEATTS